MFTKFNSNTVNKQKAGQLLLSAEEKGQEVRVPAMASHLQATLEVQVHPQGSSKRRRREEDAPDTGYRYTGTVCLKGGNNSIKTFVPGSVHVIDVHRIKLDTDDVHGDGVHSNVLVVWPDGGVERYDPFVSAESIRSCAMQEFLDVEISQWISALSGEFHYKSQNVSPIMHGPQFVEYMNSQSRTAGEHFCYIWCVLFVAELVNGAASVQEAHERMLSSLGLAPVTAPRIGYDASAAYLAAIRATVKKHNLG